MADGKKRRKIVKQPTEHQKELNKEMKQLRDSNFAKAQQEKFKSKKRRRK